MSLATRCTNCATVFRVVQDQLRVSEGWVRCGRCGEVFNAVAALVNLDAATAPQGPRAPARSAAPADRVEHAESDLAPPPDFQDTLPHTPEEPEVRRLAVSVPQRAEAMVVEGVEGVDGVEGVEEEFVVSDVEPMTPAPRFVDRDPVFERLLEPSTEALPAAAPVEAPAMEAVHASATDIEPPPSPDEADERIEAPFETPSFVQSADRAARWQRPGVRRALVALAALGMLALGIQVAFEFRAQTVARWPALRPAWDLACGLAGCTVDALRQVESLSVESSGLIRIEGTTLYRLSVVLRNKAALELAAPSLDLSLTDAQGKVIARRVLSLAELGVGARTLAAGAEVPIQVALGVAERQVVGYTVELFYP